ncbi:MAG TPA: thermonuclease family protein [Patescibacteria group bacterium]|nr:thermonuclease family protein [Patescibacteria group bacterium]
MNFKRNSKKASVFLFLGTCLILIGYLFYSLKKFEVIRIVSSPSPTPIENNQVIYAKVIKVFDGDTIQIETGQNVRYIGVDTTEVYPNVECYSLKAKKENENLVLGKTVRLEKDVSGEDKYGRLLRYIYIDDKFVNDELVKNGFAKVFTFPPDVKYQNQFKESEKYARENSLGLWNTCKPF